MKKFFTLFLTLLICLSIVACQSESTEKGGSGLGGTAKESVVGRWFCTYQRIDESGNYIGDELVTLILNEDGTALYNDLSGTWDSSGKYEIRVTLAEEELNFTVETLSEEHFFLQRIIDRMPAEMFLREYTDSYSAAYDRIVREWYSKNGDILLFREDGSILYNGEILDSKWSIVCMGGMICLDYGSNYLYYQTLQIDNKQDVFLDFRYSEKYSGEFYSSEYTTLITVDNWTEYFDSKMNISYEIIYITNEWGEKEEADNCYLHGYVTLEEAALYGKASEILVEYICGTEAAVYRFDEATQQAIKEHTDNSPLNGEKETFTYYFNEDKVFMFSDSVREYDEFVPESVEIVRMRGILFKPEFDSLPN